MTQVGFSRTLAALLIAAAVSAAPAALDAQTRGGAMQPAEPPEEAALRQGRGGRGQITRGPLTPRDIQAQFDNYVIGQAGSVLLISEDQRAPFVQRVRRLQRVRRQARIERNRLLADASRMLRGQDADEARLSAATRALDEHERATLASVQKAYAAIDEILTPWQRARFRVLEDRLEQKKLDMLSRARQGSGR